MTIQWSVSQSWLAEACPLQWWLRYRFRAKPAQPEAPNRVAGRARHLALDVAYRQVLALPARRRSATMESTAPLALEALNKYWQRQDPEVPAHELLRAHEEITALLARLPMPTADRIIGPESPFSYLAPGSLVTVVGMIDLGLWTGDSSAHLRDWKSNGIPDTVHGNVQLAVYYFVIRSLHRFLTEVTVGLYSIRQNREVYDTLDPETATETMRQLVEQAVRVDEQARAADEPGADVLRIFPPQPGSYVCGACVFRSYCPAMTSTPPPVREGIDVAAEQARLAHRLDSATGIAS